MSCLLFKLRFTAPVHFGSNDGALSLYSSEEHFLADTLFSALCHTALRRDGEEGIARLRAMAESGTFRLSDAMPFSGEELYLPKPYISAETGREIPASLRKAVKKLKWIPVSAFGAFTASLHGGEPFVPQGKTAFGTHEEYSKAAIHEGTDAEPYQVGTFRFFDDCGLWFLCLCAGDDSDWIEHLVPSLGLSGIGGEISSGCGSFEVDDLIYLDEPFDAQSKWLHDAIYGSGENYLLLTSCLPDNGELDEVMADASFQLVRRGGFVQSESYAHEPRKKETQYFLAAGSVIHTRFNGTVFEVGNSNCHPVLRYSKPVLLGVSL